ncbi:MAG TPA: aminotransferase class I/II-fold pyridoxal phosphate-dependent enzyme, partial [Ignavibacteriales bacterium]|nr:aminotransferase class I/II-fold pyridoxal phosphate-dependent enzyme [Ignavibacteriales bacterium]
MNSYDYYLKKLQYLEQKNLIRDLKKIDKKENQNIFIENKKLLNLSSNDYLGIGTNNEILREFYNYLLQNNLLFNIDFTSSSSRLLTGNSNIYTELENKIANLYQKQKAIIFNSGYHLNSGLLPALTEKNDVIFSDKLNHASIIDGIKLSDAEHFRYNHLNYNHLETLLQKYREQYNNAIIVSESLFSMDGDIADLKKLVELKNKYNCLLYIDEAHAIGVFGEKGLGLAEELNIISDIDILIATFGKAFASIGAFCVVNDILYRYILNTARSLIFTTALPSVNLYWTNFILDEIINLTSERQYLKRISSEIRSFIENSTQSKSISQSQIIPIII